MRELVTFVIPCAPHHRELVQEAVQSVYQQTVPCLARVIEDKKGQGPGACRNKGLRSVTTPFVVFLDADDLVAPEFAERCLAVWQPGRYVWTHWYADGRVYPAPHTERPIYHLITTLMSTDAALLVKGFNETTQAEDTDFYLRLTSAGVTGKRVAQPLVFYSTHGKRARDLHDSGELVPTLARLAEGHALHWLPPPKASPPAAAHTWLGQAPVKLPTWARHSAAPVPPTANGVPPRLSIVAPTCNRKTSLQRMVYSVRRTLRLPYEIILVDGGSTDGTLIWARGEKDIRLIEHGALLGTVKAFSDGGKAANAPYVLLCNDDTEFLPEAIERAYTWLEARPSSGAVAFAYALPSHPGQFIVGKHVFQLPGGQVMERPFANMGLYRKRLGDAAGWCGADDPDFKARSYGSDSYISERIWELGYSIDAVAGACVLDHDVHDRLKQVNQWPPSLDNPDTRAFYRRFPEGAHIPLKAQV